MLILSSSHSISLLLLLSLTTLFSRQPCEVSGKTVLVIGASGRVGRAVVSRLLSSGVSVRGLVRSDAKRPERISALEKEAKESLSPSSSTVPTPLKYYEGDVNDLDSLVAATSGCDAVVDCHGVRPPRFTKIYDLFRHPANDKTHPYMVNYVGSKKLLAAMHVNGVNKLVRITGSLVGKSPFKLFVFLFNALLSMTNKWHERSEIAIRASGIDYSIIRPTELSSEPRASITNRTLLLLSADSGESPPVPGKISIEDIADLIVTSVTDQRFSKATVLVSSCPPEKQTGPQTWEPLLGKVCSDRIALRRSPHELAMIVYTALISLTVVTAARLAALVIGAGWRALAVAFKLAM